MAYIFARRNGCGICKTYPTEKAAISFLVPQISRIRQAAPPR